MEKLGMLATAPQPMCQWCSKNRNHFLHCTTANGVCNVWNEENYLTFDGRTFDFDGNCSYYLVKEIIPEYNLTISVTKEDCEYSGDSKFCFHSLNVGFKSDMVLIKQSNSSGTVQKQVYVNGKQVYPAYKNEAILITGTDIVVNVEIPEIKTEVVYRDSSISVELPQSLIGKNTEGQCGMLNLLKYP
ncbi:hypothetical protein WMY93_006885 [Mugilogobius chulae]|uniref:VWFD domain-containing protein n=1 Tax=Mugilogobius chulae TaxID=88201 RepID=A0AAW0PLT6_9GOBI